MNGSPPAMGRLRLLGLAFALIGALLAEGVLACLIGLAVCLIPLGVGIPMFDGLMLALRRVIDTQRRAATRLTGRNVDRPYGPRPAGGQLAGLRGMLADPATWRDLAWTAVDWTAGAALLAVPTGLFLNGVWSLAFPYIYSRVPYGDLNDNWGFFQIHSQASAFATLPVGVASLALFWLLTPPVMHAYGQMAASLLGPTERMRLTERVSWLSESRDYSVNSHAAEVKRIERDLHDGAQARLVAMGMTLGAAEELLESNPAAARALLSEARHATVTALDELRDLVRGIHPPVLADRGLGDALRALALGSGMNVKTRIDLPDRLEPPVESAAYFAVSELLTNAAKHSGARQVWIEVKHDKGMLRVDVTDDGHGGADANGAGLRGLEQRLAAFDGILAVSSPPGGPTIATVEVPCRTLTDTSSS